MNRKPIVTMVWGALLCTLPALALAGKPSVPDLKVGTIYFADGTSQSTASLQGPMGPEGAVGPQGPTGASGYHSLILLTDEMSGSNCANGGTKFQVGLDQSRNGTLESGEVVQTEYLCSGTPGPEPMTVTASPATQAVNSYVNITATTINPDGTPASGSVSFATSGSCSLYDPNSSSLGSYVSAYSYGGVASAALTNTDPDGGPCIVYAGYYDSSTQSELSGSALATFVTTLPATSTPEPMTVTASPATQAVNAYVNITATIKNPDGTPFSGRVDFGTSGSCRLYDPNNSTLGSYAYAYSYGGVASVALTNTNPDGGPCIVYAGYYDSATQNGLSGSALATFVPPVPAN